MCMNSIRKCKYLKHLKKIYLKVGKAILEKDFSRVSFRDCQILTTRIACPSFKYSTSVNCSWFDSITGSFLLQMYIATIYRLLVALIIYNR